jgi:hypothetical protein
MFLFFCAPEGDCWRRLRQGYIAHESDWSSSSRQTERRLALAQLQRRYKKKSTLQITLCRDCETGLIELPQGGAIAAGVLKRPEPVQDITKVGDGNGAGRAVRSHQMPARAKNNRPKIAECCR